MKTSNLVTDNNPLGPALQRYFCHYLIGQRDVSPQTINAYRDTFKLLLRFLEKRYRKKADELSVVDLSASRILAFLDDLEQRRSNSARSRNARLAAIRSFMRDTASVEPLLLSFVQRILAIPLKRFDHCDVGYLGREQMQSLIAAPDGSTKTGLRDRVLLMLMYNTGARVSEITALRVGDLRLEDGGAIHIRGKGRKQRAVPLWRRTVRLLRQWLKEIDNSSDKPLLPNSRGIAMTRAGIAQRLRHAMGLAAKQDSTLRSAEFRRTRFGTLLPCICCNRASTCPSSQCGWVMRAFRRPISTYKLIWKRRREHFQPSTHRNYRVRLERPPNRSFSFWKGYDYANL